MCMPANFDPMSAVVSALAGQALGGLFGKKSGTPQPATPAVSAPPASQAAQTPDESAVRASSSRGASEMGSAGSTLLTGGQGVSPTLLALGKNTLLGQG